MPHLFKKALLVLYLILLIARSVSAEDAMQPGVFRVDPPTLHSLGFRWYLEGDDDGDATCSVQYRAVGAERWLEALPLLRVNREEVDRDFENYGANAGVSPSRCPWRVGQRLRCWMWSISQLGRFTSRPLAKCCRPMRTG
jgi:hypothetical protein